MSNYQASHHGPVFQTVCFAVARTGCQTTLDKISLSTGRARMRRRKWSAISGWARRELRYRNERAGSRRLRVAVASQDIDGMRTEWDDLAQRWVQAGGDDSSWGRNFLYVTSRDSAIAATMALGAQINV